MGNRKGFGRTEGSFPRLAHLVKEQLEGGSQEEAHQGVLSQVGESQGVVLLGEVTQEVVSQEVVLHGVYHVEVFLGVASQGKVCQGVVCQVAHKENMNQLVEDNNTHNNQDMWMQH